MSAPRISIRGVGKKFTIGEGANHSTLRDQLAEGFRRLFKREARKEAMTDYWALRDVTFDVGEGEVVGIVGRNGAGKSTLLKVLSQISEPTEGEVTMRGRVSSLLEVGTGFHPELTGRENIFLNGAILGMTHAEIKRKFDEIVAFAEVEKFLDTPVKRYSSGMYVRLAFAVAAHLEPEILIVDEVLAVGDAEFQRKCLGKIHNLAESEGRTVLFVSHNLTAVQRLCTHGVYLENGRLKDVGTITKVLDAYQRSFEQAANVVSTTGKAQFISWALEGNPPEEKHCCHTRSVCEFSVTTSVQFDIDDAVIGFAIWNPAGDLVFAASSRDDDGPLLSFAPGLHQVKVTVRLPLKADLYQLEISINSRALGQLERCYLEPKLNILPLMNTTLPEKWHGLITEKATFGLMPAPQPTH